MKTDVDCMRQTLATLLQIDPDNIPLFQGDNWERNYDDWLYATQQCIRFTTRELDNPDTRIPSLSSNVDLLCIGILHKGDRDYDHAVVLQLKQFPGAKKVKMRVYHDPKPNTDYTIDDLIAIEIVLQIPKSNPNIGYPDVEIVQ